MRIIRFVLVIVIYVGLSACATSGSANYPGNSTANSKYNKRIVVNQNYVQQVEHMAKKRGVEIVWLNPPTKRVD